MRGIEKKNIVAYAFLIYFIWLCFVLDEIIISNKALSVENLNIDILPVSIHNNNDDDNLARQQRRCKNGTDGGDDDEVLYIDYDEELINNPITKTNDLFSASWIQSTHRFLKTPLHLISSVESACFVTFRQKMTPTGNITISMDGIRMTLDWLDFSVEHLSKWFKQFKMLDNKESNYVPYENFISKLSNYIKNIITETKRRHHNDDNSAGIDNDRLVNTNAMKNTIAVIAFQIYKGNNDERSEKLTMLNLAATIASLFYAGFGRVVVVGCDKGDYEYVKNSYKLLHGTYHNNGNKNGETGGNSNSSVSGSGNHGDTSAAIESIGNGMMEVGYVQTNVQDMHSEFVSKNMPKAALVGLQRALNGTLSSLSTNNDDYGYDEEDWLGTRHDRRSYWKYVYLTEPDTILHTRISTLESIRSQLDKGYVIPPHRLQPIPHGLDVEGFKKEHLYVPNNGIFSKVFDLQGDWSMDDSIHKNNQNIDASQNDEGSTDACCDAAPEWPGRMLPRCGHFWYLCGFSREERNSDPHSAHKRLLPYDFIRLGSGTGVVSLAGNEHGRRCIPKKKGDKCTKLSKTYLQYLQKRAWNQGNNTMGW